MGVCSLAASVAVASMYVGAYICFSFINIVSIPTMVDTFSCGSFPAIILLLSNLIILPVQVKEIVIIVIPPASAVFILTNRAVF